MYQLIRAYAREDRRKGRWTPVDLTGVSVRDLPQMFPEVWLIITYPALDGVEQALYFEDVSNLTKDALQSTTVQEWLTGLGNLTIPLREEVPTFEDRFVKYINAWYGNFQLDPIGPSRRLEPEVSKYDKDDLLIQHPSMDGPTLRKQAMVSINGFFHFTEWMEQGILVHYGNRSIRHSNMNQIGIHSFKDIGEINYKRIDPDLIFNKGGDTPLSEGVYVTLDGEVDEYKDKTILFVFNGYLQVLGKGYTRVGEKSFRIQLSNLLMLERYYQASHFIDMTDIPLTEYTGDENLVSTSEFHSDEMIRWSLLRSQTFFVVVDTPSMFHELESLEHLNIPGRFMDNQGTPYPLVGTYGRTLEYRRLHYPNSQFVIATQANKRFNFDFHHMPWKDNAGINDGSNSARPFTHDHAYWRILGTQD